jgi:DNA helicase-2/ATP-dependent DNA helicase PcrA
MPFDYLAELNPEQRRAVQYGVKPGSANHAGPLLAIAGAGTGKTKTLTHRVAHLIANGISPHRILPLTFTPGCSRDDQAGKTHYGSGAWHRPG